MRLCVAGVGSRVLIALGVTVGAYGPAPAVAQLADTVDIVAGPQYAAGGFHEALLGRDYRDLWTKPVRVPLLDLRTFGGGLAATERGGGEQTRSLRLIGNDGREYNFRSVNKWLTPDPRSDFEGTPAEALVQDQVSSLHPAGAIVATGLLGAVGLMNPDPQLVIMPDDPALGEFREEFAGMLGTIEVHPNETDNGLPVFGGASAIEGEDDLFLALRQSPTRRAAARTLLAERLMSLLMADWDRHAGQYRWARYDSAGVHAWVPIAEDRDYALADYDGLAFSFLGSLLPEGAPFRDRYRSKLLGLIENSAEVDRRLLAELSWSDWGQTVNRRRQRDIRARGGAPALSEARSSILTVP